MTTPKDDLHRYLQAGREAVLWKLDGLAEYDVRRPLVPTGTNLLGLVKHLASVEFGYFGDCFDRPHGEELPWWDDDAEPNADMWATPDESRDDIVALYRRTPTPRSRRSTSTPSDGSRGGLPIGPRSASTASWCTWRPRPTATPDTPTSSAS
jgi:hypothetical protein